MVADIEEFWNPCWETQCKGSADAQNGENITFPIADGTVKLSGGDQILRTSTLIWDHRDRGEEQEHLPGESDGSSPPFQDSSRDDGEARNDFSSISGNYSYRHHVEPRANCTCREKNHSQFHHDTSTWLEQQSTTLDVMLERSQTILGMSTEPETFQNRGQDSHDSPSWKKNLQIGIHGPGSGWRRNKRHQGLITCGQGYGQKCQKQRNEKSNKNGLSRNRSLITLEDYAVFTSFIQQMRSSKKLSKQHGESWNFRCQQQCLQRAGKECTRKLVAILILPRQNTYASLKSTNLREALGRNCI